MKHPQVAACLRGARGPRAPLALVLAITAMTVALSAHPAERKLDVAAADNAFGFRLLNAVQHLSPDANVVLSPVSAALDLSMVLDAATDQTRQQLLNVLALDGWDVDAINAANAQLISVTRSPAPGVTLSLADSLWINSRRVQLRSDYVKQLQAGYEAEISLLDFSRPGAVTRINDWTSQATAGKISAVIDRVDPADLAILANAVYFKGRWMHQFDPAQTRQRDFTLAGGGVQQVPRMTQTGRFDYVETADMQSIRLPFGDGDLVMYVVLPSRSSSLNALQARLSAANWAQWRTRYTSRAGTIELPRFELKANYRLNEALESLGMVRAFQPDAQLTGMFAPEADHSNPARFFISSVLQSTDWKVDEEGAEAAAVTTIGVRSAAVTRSAPPFQMIVDRPFFCAIEDRRSDALLFVAAIHDPDAS